MKKESIVFLVLALALCLTPTVLTLALGESEPLSNELRAPLPVAFGEGGSGLQYPALLGDWFADHFQPRPALISARNALFSAAGVSGAENVTLGHNGWLYYAPTERDFTGEARMTERELYAAASNLRLMQEYAEAEGAAFLFAIAPNKNSLYPEYMPCRGAIDRERNAVRLSAMLRELEVPFADLESALRETHEVLYYAHDSHWNQKGAALAADVINAAFGVSSAYYPGEFSAVGTHQGDLFEMLYPAFADGEAELLPENAPVTDYAGRPDAVSIRAKGKGERSLLCFRDSFGNALYPYLAEQSAESVFLRSKPYDLTRLEETHADALLIELVERNLPELIAEAPLMPSPPREIRPRWALPHSVALHKETSQNEPEGLTAWEGTLDLPADTNSPIYVSSDGLAVEAFLLSGDRFFIRVPQAFEPEAVAFYHDGELYSVGVVIG